MKLLNKTPCEHCGIKFKPIFKMQRALKKSLKLKNPATFPALDFLVKAMSLMVTGPLGQDIRLVYILIGICFQLMITVLALRPFINQKPLSISQKLLFKKKK